MLKTADSVVGYKIVVAFPKARPQPGRGKHRMMKRTAKTAGLIRTTLALCAIFFASFFAKGANGQIAKLIDDDGRRFFVNSEPLRTPKLTASRPRTNIYLPAEASFTGRSHPAVDMGRDGVEKIVREAADRHRVDPALVRAVIETESNWNPKAWSHKGAGGLMQLIPTTAQRYGASDVFNPQQNIDAGVKHLKWLLERYNGNLDLALAAYNAGEGVVDAYVNSRAIHRDVSPDGRIIFTNE